MLDNLATGPNPIRVFGLEVTIIVGHEVDVRLQKAEQEGMTMGSGADNDEFLDLFPRGMAIKVGIQIILGTIRFVKGSAGIAGANMNSIVAASSLPARAWWALLSHILFVIVLPVVVDCVRRRKDSKPSIFFGSISPKEKGKESRSLPGNMCLKIGGPRPHLSFKFSTYLSTLRTNV